MLKVCVPPAHWARLVEAFRQKVVEEPTRRF